MVLFQFFLFCSCVFMSVLMGKLDYHYIYTNALCIYVCADG